jgi:hypothetical protein
MRLVIAIQTFFRRAAVSPMIGAREHGGGVRDVAKECARMCGMAAKRAVHQSPGFGRRSAGFLQATCYPFLIG